MKGWLPRLRWSLAFAAIVACLVPVGVSALDVPPAPKDMPVVDQTKTLSDEQKQALAAKIAKERSETGNQIAVLVIKTLEGNSLEDYSLEVARGWGVGQKERNSGVLLLVAKDDRKLRIEVGYGLEGALPDIRANQIISDRITPQFREGKYYEGINSGIDGIVAAIHGEKDPHLKPESSKPASWWRWIEPLLFVGFFLIIWLGSILARTKSWWAGGIIGGTGGVVVGLIFGFLFVGLVAIAGMALLGLLFDKVVSDNYQKAAKGSRDKPSWWAGGPWIGGGGTGGGSGGFGGFSGGSFGGGGSSGDW